MVTEEKMRSNVHRITPKKEEKPEAVDREKTCPLLLRVFTSKGIDAVFFTGLGLIYKIFVRRASYHFNA